MAKKLTVVVSQGQGSNPAKRKLEEDLVAGLLFEQGVEVTVIPNLYDLSPDGTGMLCLQGITGDMVVLSWLYPRAAHWILDRNGIRGRAGSTLLVDDAEDDEDEEEVEAAAAADDGRRVEDHRPLPNRTIWSLDLRARPDAAPFLEEIRRIAAESTVETVDLGLMGWIHGTPRPAQLERYLDPQEPASPASPAADGLSSPAAGETMPAEGIASDAAQRDAAQVVRIADAVGRRWYPVIDYSRCTNCLECLDFCLFGVYGVAGADQILVEQPDNCRKGCPACSRVCPENAIIFPQHKTPAIAGSPSGAAGALKIDLSKLFGAPDALQVAVVERDVELVAAGRDAVGMAVGVPKRQTGKQQAPKDDLDALMDKLDNLEL